MRKMQKDSWQMRCLIYLAVLCGTVGADQLTKALAVRYLKPIAALPLWEGVFHLTYVQNPGAAFGMLQNHRWVFLIFSTVGIAAIGVYLWKMRDTDWLTASALLLVMGGGIGNMIDRLALGYVVDFFDFTLINFAVFNVADIFVCVGCGLMFLWLFKFAEFDDEKKPSDTKPTDSPDASEEPDDASDR